VLGVELTVIESVELEPDGRGGEQLIARVRAEGGGGVAVLAVSASRSRL